MRYGVVVMLETELHPKKIIEEIVSTLEFDLPTATTVSSIVVLIGAGETAAVYHGKRNPMKGGVT